MGKDMSKLNYFKWTIAFLCMYQNCCVPAYNYYGKESLQHTCSPNVWFSIGPSMVTSQFLHPFKCVSLQHLSLSLIETPRAYHTHLYIYSVMIHMASGLLSFSWTTHLSTTHLSTPCCKEHGLWSWPAQVQILALQLLYDLEQIAPFKWLCFCAVLGTLGFAHVRQVPCHKATSLSPISFTIKSW